MVRPGGMGVIHDRQKGKLILDTGRLPAMADVQNLSLASVAARHDAGETSSLDPFRTLMIYF